MRGVSAILFDEFHERHLYGDITLARALQLQENARPDLKIVVMSATLDTGSLDKFLEPCALLTSSGRQHPVAIEYLPKPVRAEDYPIWDLAADELVQLAPVTEGDVLIFMPGKYEIMRTFSAVRASRVSSDFVALPLCTANCRRAEQDAALATYDKRKVDRRHERRRNVAHDRRRAGRDRQRAGADCAVRRAARDQHAACREDQPRFRRSARGPRRTHRAGTLPAALDRTRTLRTRRAGVAGSETPRSRRSRPHAQGERRGGRGKLSLARAAGAARARARRAVAGRSGGCFALVEKSPRSAGACSPFQFIRATRACCWRRRNIAASARLRSSPPSRRVAICCAARRANRRAKIATTCWARTTSPIFSS